MILLRMSAYKFNNLNQNNKNYKINNRMKERQKLEILLIIYNMKLIDCSIMKITITFNRLA